MKFHEIAKSARLARRLSLRQFCFEVGLDPSNWSKVERGINQPPKDSEALESIASHLDLSGYQRQEFLDSAAVARNELPADFATDDAIISKLPAFFRVMRGEEPNKENLLQMVSDIQKLNKPDQR